MKNTRQAGRAFVLKVLERVKAVDSGSYEVVGSGAGKVKGDLRMPRFDLVAECKDWDKVSMGSWTRQTDRQGLGYNKVALFWRHPDSPKANPDIRVDLAMDYFLELLARAGDPIVKREDREFKFKVERLKSAAHEILKEMP